MKMVNEEQMASLRRIVKGLYDIQDMRLRTGLRVVTQWKIKLGQAPGTKETELTEDVKAMLKALRDSYRTITEGVLKNPKPADFKGDALVSTFTEFCLIQQYLDLEAAEKKHVANLKNYIETVPLYKDFLVKIKGVGPMMGGVICSHLDIRKAKYPSSLWQYVGVSVGPDGMGMSKKKEHLVKRKYIDKNGKEAERDGTVFNPFVKTKLVGVLGDIFVKQKADACPYRKFYDDYKHRLESHPVYGLKNDGKKAEVTDEATGKKTKVFITSKARRHRMAIRYAIKMFLLDLYLFWREAEGLEVSKPYSEGKLGIKHGPDGHPTELPPEVEQSNQERIKKQLMDLGMDGEEDAA